MRIDLFHDLTHAHLRQFFRDYFFVEQTLLDGRFVLHEGRDQFIQILAADAHGLVALRLHQAFDLHLDLARLLVHAHVAFRRIVAALAVVEAGCRLIVRVLRLEFKPRCQHLLHEQAGGDGFERVVHCLRHRRFGGIRLGNEIGESRVRLARRVAGRATDDLHDLREAGAIADRQRVLAPNPVKALLGHPQRDDDVHMVAIVLLRGIAQRGGDALALHGIVIHQIGNFQNPPVRRLHQLEARRRVGALPFAEFLNDVLRLLDLVLRALA